jgi:hypothetical protein
LTVEDPDPYQKWSAPYTKPIHLDSGISKAFLPLRPSTAPPAQELPKYVSAAFGSPAMEQHFTHLGEEDLKLYKAMRRWHNEVGDMLAYVNDVLHPHGFDEIVKDDFAALRQMLSRVR